ncbi:hypothetical protein ACIBCO_10655 [Streptomyces violascens]|uniref:hypothetical protein n=1 Tax=Streptomyces violascens TaxID=67381 RepID=UPI003791BD0A
MNANVALAVSVSDDLVIEEFGRYAASSRPAYASWGSGVTQVPVSVSAETSRHTV